MIRFNALLRNEGIDPAHVKLVRHQDTRYPERQTPYQLWKRKDGRFDLYQRLQSRPVFKKAKFLASFVGTPLDETLFVGFYEIRGVGRAPRGLIDPISEKKVAGLYLYQMRKSPKLADYSGRLAIEWGEGYRSWVQRARKQDKAVVEILRVEDEPPFPGFLDFAVKLSSLASVPRTWREVLSSVSGVYVLIHPDNGRPYVGSAQGSDGFWGRWEQYVASGHGGNKRMKEVRPADYQVTILEVASSSASPKEIVEMEERWKRKLLSRKFGLNG